MGLTGLLANSSEISQLDQQFQANSNVRLMDKELEDFRVSSIQEILAQ